MAPSLIFQLLWKHPHDSRPCLILNTFPLSLYSHMNPYQRRLQCQWYCWYYLSEWGGASRSHSIKATHYKKAVQFEVVSLVPAPSGKLAGANLFDLRTLQNRPVVLKCKSIKAVRHSQHLVTLLQSDGMRQLCRQQGKLIRAFDWDVVRWNTRWAGLISFTIRSIKFRVCAGEGGRDQARDRAEERQTLEKSQVSPAHIQMCLLRQDALRTESMLKTGKEPWTEFLFFPFYYHDTE